MSVLLRPGRPTPSQACRSLLVWASSLSNHLRHRPRWRKRPPVSGCLCAHFRAACSISVSLIPGLRNSAWQRGRRQPIAWASAAARWQSTRRLSISNLRHCPSWPTRHVVGDQSGLYKSKARPRESCTCMHQPHHPTTRPDPPVTLRVIGGSGSGSLPCLYPACVVQGRMALQVIGWGAGLEKGPWKSLRPRVYLQPHKLTPRHGYRAPIP